jgi:hypothetical protein
MRLRGLQISLYFNATMEYNSCINDEKVINVYFKNNVRNGF